MKRESFVSALTLAGAAEELLGNALSSVKEQNALEWRYIMMESTLSLFRQAPKQEFITLENRARDAAKHQRPGGTHLDIEDEALWMIVRASDNARRLGLPPPFTQGIENHGSDFWLTHCLPVEFAQLTKCLLDLRPADREAELQTEPLTPAPADPPPANDQPLHQVALAVSAGRR